MEDLCDMVSRLKVERTKFDTLIFLRERAIDDKVSPRNLARLMIEYNKNIIFDHTNSIYNDTTNEQQKYLQIICKLNNDIMKRINNNSYNITELFIQYSSYIINYMKRWG